MVAIVDDDIRLLESLSDLLQSTGYATRAFPSAQLLLNSRLEDIDVLIADIGMEGIDGFELRRRVSEIRPSLPVFLITGRHEIADQDRARDAGGFFRKPYDALALLAAIADVVHRPEGKGEDDE